LGWKLDSNIFPTSYLEPNLDTRKASKSRLEKGAAHWGGAAHWEKFSSVNLHWRGALGEIFQCKFTLALRTGLKRPEIISNLPQNCKLFIPQV